MLSIGVSGNIYVSSVFFFFRFEEQKKDQKNVSKPSTSAIEKIPQKYHVSSEKNATNSDILTKNPPSEAMEVAEKTLVLEVEDEAFFTPKDTSNVLPTCTSNEPGFSAGTASNVAVLVTSVNPTVHISSGTAVPTVLSTSKPSFASLLKPKPAAPALPIPQLPIP